MFIEIKHRIAEAVILSGEYTSVRDCLEKNRGADLGGADLGGAYLRGADLRGAYLGGAYLRGAYLGGADLGGADLGGAYLRGAYLRGAGLGGADLGGADLGGAYLGGAYLGGAYLRGAYLGGADLRGAEYYAQSHDVFAEVVRRQKVDVFVDAEWSAIAQITIHRLCWDTIKNRFRAVMPHIFEILAEVGFTEWLAYWNTITRIK